MLVDQNGFFLFVPIILLLIWGKSHPMNSEEHLLVKSKKVLKTKRSRFQLRISLWVSELRIWFMVQMNNEDPYFKMETFFFNFFFYILLISFLPSILLVFHPFITWNVEFWRFWFSDTHMKKLRWKNCEGKKLFHFTVWIFSFHLHQKSYSQLKNLQIYPPLKS